jgi:hypothetical protein
MVRLADGQARSTGGAAMLTHGADSQLHVGVRTQARRRQASKVARALAWQVSSWARHVASLPPNWRHAVKGLPRVRPQQQSLETLVAKCNLCYIHRVDEDLTWLLLLHRLPVRPTRLRVRVWRQLQKLGAVAVKNSVYVLPWSERTLEDFTWLRQEIEAGGGEAVLFRAASVAGLTDDEIVAAFRRERDTAYARLTADLQILGDKIGAVRDGITAAPETQEAFQTEVETMQAEFDRLGEMDFFAAAGKAPAAAALARVRHLMGAARGRKTPAPRRGSRAELDVSKFQGKRWVTRPRPHIDRCASAWLIRRFIDRRARFGFAAEGGNMRSGIPFDMAGADFGHHGEDCTFETLMKRFGLDGDAAVCAIAEIVHDIDLKDGKFGRAEAAGVNVVLRGLMERIRDDHRLLRETAPVFDGLYATLAQQRARRKRAARSRK